MADYKILNENASFSPRQYLIDTESDIINVPTNEVGAVVLIAATSDVYILNNKKEWTKL